MNMRKQVVKPIEDRALVTMSLREYQSRGYLWGTVVRAFLAGVAVGVIIMIFLFSQNHDDDAAPAAPSTSEATQ